MLEDWTTVNITHMNWTMNPPLCLPHPPPLSLTHLPVAAVQEPADDLL